MNLNIRLLLPLSRLFLSDLNFELGSSQPEHPHFTKTIFHLEIFSFFFPGSFLSFCSLYIRTCWCHQMMVKAVGLVIKIAAWWGIWACRFWLLCRGPKLCSEKLNAALAGLVAKSIRGNLYLWGHCYRDGYQMQTENLLLLFPLSHPLPIRHIHLVKLCSGRPHWWPPIKQVADRARESKWGCVVVKKTSESLGSLGNWVPWKSRVL